MDYRTAYKDLLQKIESDGSFTMSMLAEHMREVEKKIEGVTVLNIKDEISALGGLIGQKEIAEILEIPQRYIAKYYATGKFPEPIAYPAGRPVWLRSQIESLKRG